MKKVIEKILFVIAVIIIGIIACKIPWQNNWFNFITKWISQQKNLGSIAEWAGAVSSVFAIFVGFCQVIKQNKFNRVLKIEGFRPKFTCHFLSKANGKDSIILTNDSNISLSDVDLMLKHAEEHCLIEVRNISKNSVYKIDIKLIYDGTDEIFNFTGFQSSQKIILVPGKAMQGKKEKLKKKIIKFVTPGNETGYCLYGGTYRYKERW